MSVQRESKRESYDAVVIGSGMGGLSAAALLARAGRSVLVLERHDRPGGYAHSFQRRKYKFDAGVHVISGCESLGGGWGALLHDILSLVGTRHTVEFAKVDPLYGALYPDLRFSAPTGVMEFMDAHARLYPDEARGLKAFFRLLARINQETYHFPPEASSYETLRDTSRFPVHAQLREATVQGVLDEHLTSPRLKALLSTQWMYLGLPPSRLSILKFSSMLMSFLSTGAYFPRGGMQVMVNALVAGIQAHGGEVMVGTPVRRVMVEKGRAAGVILENGQRVRAPIVVSNADARQTFDELVGVEHLPAGFVTALRALRPSLSAITLYLATDLDLRAVPGLEHETFVYGSWDHDESYAGMLAGEPSSVMLSAPTLVDPSLAPPGEHLVNVLALMPFAHARSWREKKPEYMELLLARSEKALPGLREHVTFVEGASPRTMERYTLNHMGAIYGWEQSPEQGGANRLSRVTPVAGLYLSGHWTQPGGGAMSAAASGAQTAQLLLGFPTVGEMFTSLRASPPNVPAAPPA
jgi:prolycopene isomerase